MSDPSIPPSPVRNVTRRGVPGGGRRQGSGHGAALYGRCPLYVPRPTGPAHGRVDTPVHDRHPAGCDGEEATGLQTEGPVDIDTRPLLTDGPPVVGPGLWEVAVVVLGLGPVGTTQDALSAVAPTGAVVVEVGVPALAVSGPYTPSYQGTPGALPSSLGLLVSIVEFRETEVDPDFV